MPAADFCGALRVNRYTLSPASGTHHRPPEVSSTAFSAQPPDLPPVLLMDADFIVIGQLVPHRRPHHPVFVHRLACLLHASFRPHLATTPLRFARPSPPSGWEEDFHLPAVEHARHTKRKARSLVRAFTSFWGPKPRRYFTMFFPKWKVGPSEKRIVFWPLFNRLLNRVVYT